MSFALTTQQMFDGTKDVTRRAGWVDLQVGQQVQAVKKVMGLKKGEPIEPLGVIEVVSIRREPLNAIDTADVSREGFPGQTPAEFVAMFCRHMGGEPDQLVTRIEFRKVSPPMPAKL